jgi:hypothetical protein
LFGKILCFRPKFCTFFRKLIWLCRPAARCWQAEGAVLDFGVVLGAALGFIQSVSIREPERIKDVRLFHLASILGFIERCEMKAKSDLVDTSKSPQTRVDLLPLGVATDPYF